jgi:hypothetical protein
LINPLKGTTYKAELEKNAQALVYSILHTTSATQTTERPESVLRQIFLILILVELQ